MNKKILGLVMACTIGFSAAYADDYHLVWEENFDGTSLNKNDWNYEFHRPGWVNNELQSYDASEDNTYVKDGKLVIQPLASKALDGSYKYTSGRINTQGKHIITYGKVEVCAKVPSGQGFLPAIWMMPNDENLYGQWPKCGEIDIMEVLGSSTNTLYSTIHYGEPHKEGQEKKIISGDFSKEYHVFGMEWEPGEIRFYLDGELYHTENDWYTKKSGQTAKPYPAPFNQPFYLILNVAVGGNWPGNPDETTKFDKNAAMYVDYVKFYQKDFYDENVTRPEKTIVLRDPDSTGNYVNNATFEDEDLATSPNWTFLTAGKGKASANIADNEIHIITQNCGELEYSVQLVQPNIPMKKGSKYRVTFDIRADEPRTAIVAVTAPNVGWIRYLKDTKFMVETKKKTVTYNFTMKDDDDPTGRLEFNLGAQNSNAAIHISNIRLEKIE